MFYLMGYNNLTGKYSELSRRNSFMMAHRDYLDAPMDSYSHFEIWNEPEKNCKYHCKKEI